LEDCLAQGVFQVRARAVVNATGPWAEGLPHSRVKLRLTKGIHLVVERARVPVTETVVMTEGERILFAIPWGERTILGTTDTDYHGPLDDVRADAKDIAYLLRVTNQFFPGARLTEADVISAWAGLRPLVADPSGKPSDISRSHEIHNPEPGWWDVAGGKLTTYRLMGEQTVDQVVTWLQGLHELHQLHGEVGRCRTAAELLLPTAEAGGVSGILPPEFSRKAVEHYVAREWAVHLDDVMVRRTSWHYYLRDATGKAQQVAGWMAGLLGWTEAQRAAEVARYSQIGSWLTNQEPRCSAEAKQR
jgi:glycerol-3-phosphate dehydrogenase